MSIDFENKENRLEYLGTKLDDLLDGINASYGKVLLDELVTRLHRTIEDFNEEFQGIMGELKDSSERRHQILHDLMEGNEPSPSTQGVSDDVAESSGVDTSEMSAWEKRLEGK